MEPQKAINIARDYVRKIYSDEKIMNIGLEEVEFLPKENIWKIGISFSREKEIIRTRAQSLADELYSADFIRKADAFAEKISSAQANKTKTVLEQQYKVIAIADNDGTVLSMKNMNSSEAA